MPHEYPIKQCDFCSTTGVMPTFLNGLTMCNTCIRIYSKDYVDALFEIKNLREETQYLRNTLEKGLNLISKAMNVSPEHYDRDQADGECYLDCFRDAAAIIGKSR
tara:strand:- start:603 stop:917 length:315 start_codon:yes stop_codon:yes gene_type:complete